MKPHPYRQTHLYQMRSDTVDLSLIIAMIQLDMVSDSGLGMQPGLFIIGNTVIINIRAVIIDSDYVVSKDTYPDLL